MADWIALITDLVRQHQIWAMPIVFLLALGESLAFLSLLLPATIILLGLGALIGQVGIPFWPIFIAAAGGGFFGDWLSYWLGDHYQQQVQNWWPFNCHPTMLQRGHAFFAHWGIIGVFLSRFFGPLRAVVPLVAGLCGMPQLRFQVANFLSAIIWAFSILSPGVFGLRWLARFIG